MQIVEQQRCSNCGDSRRENVGVCRDCYQLYQQGRVIKIKDTADKDNWSCGCYAAHYGQGWCDYHKTHRGPNGPYQPSNDLGQAQRVIIASPSACQFL